MRRCFAAMMASAALASALGFLPPRASAAISHPDSDPTYDVSACTAAAAAQSDAEQIITSCRIVIDNDKAFAADRLKALLARAGAYVRKQQDDQAIADYDVALKLDPTLTDILNARGELLRRKGDRPRALADFAAAIKLNPQHQAARANFTSLASELERLGAQMAVNNRPSFDCATGRRPVEQAICADPVLANLDRGIDRANAMALLEAGRGTARGRELLRRHAIYLARRNAKFGRPGYDLHQAMKARLEQLRGTEGY